MDRHDYLAAELLVAEVYDLARRRRPFDTTANRRGRALDRLDRELRDAIRRAGLGRDEYDRGNPPREALELAYRRLAGAHLRLSVADAVVAAVADVGDELDLERPPRLERVLNGDGRFEVYAAGASRAHR